MEKQLRLLLIEDEEDDALLLYRLLEKEGYHVKPHRVQTEPELEEALRDEEWDLVICDFRMPKLNGAEALELFKKKNLDIPFILLSGTVGEDIAVNMMKAGANDYIMKNNLRRIGPAISRELADARIRMEKKKALEELHLAKEKAIESDKLKSNLLASLSHEFRTPLTGILGFAEVIKGEFTDPFLLKNIQNIYISGKRLMSTLDSIIWMAQLESGLTPHHTMVNLGALIEEAIVPLREFALRKNLVLSVDCNEPMVIITDGNLLRVALQNLVENAIKFTKSGMIQIIVEVKPATGKSFLSMHVKDTGIGIHPDHFETIFQEFRQVSEGIGRQYEGSGLGLPIVKKIATLLNGTIGLESSVNVGSVFTLEIPLVESGLVPKPVQPDSSLASIVAEKADSPSDDRLPLPSLLIVEDNEMNRDLVMIYLRHLCQMDHAFDAETAIRMVQSKHYHAILMDINLGEGMDGIQATRIIRKLPDYRDTPVIAVTGYTLHGDKERILDVGCSHYLAKPFDKETLITLIKDVVRV